MTFTILDIDRQKHVVSVVFHGAPCGCENGYCLPQSGERVVGPTAGVNGEVVKAVERFYPGTGCTLENIHGLNRVGQVTHNIRVWSVDSEGNRIVKMEERLVDAPVPIDFTKSDEILTAIREHGERREKAEQEKATLLVLPLDVARLIGETIS